MRLIAPTDQLPLSFSQYAHLDGRLGEVADPYTDDAGRPLQGAALDRALAGEGIGLKTVRVSGAFAGRGAGDLEPWGFEVQLAGTLDAQSLARVIHAEARQFSATTKAAAGNSPPETYVTEIVVEGTPAEQKKDKPRRRRRVVRKFVAVTVTTKTGKSRTIKKAIYRDKKTGRFAKRAAWIEQGAR